MEEIPLTPNGNLKVVFGTPDGVGKVPQGRLNPPRIGRQLFPSIRL